MMDESKRIIVAITGASGAIYGLRIIHRLSSLGAEIHVVVSDSGRRTLEEECDGYASALVSENCIFHSNDDIGACLASGSFRRHAMIVAPCTVKTLSGVATCRADSLILRSADVTLKEGRPLLLLFREAPYHLGHVELMSRCISHGAIVFPPVPAFYQRPQSIEEMVDHTVDRCLERVGIRTDTLVQWNPMAVRMASHG